MENIITLVEDVVCRQVACDSDQIVVQTMPNISKICSEESYKKVMEERVVEHRATIHRFSGGPFGSGKIRIAFGPLVEEKLGLPLQCLSDRMQYLERENTRLQQDIAEYNRAGFWEKLKWVFNRHTF